MNSQINQAEVVNLIINTINTIFSNLLSSIDTKVSNSFFQNIMESHSLIYLVDSFLVGFSLYYVFKLYYSSYNEIPIEKPYQFFFKILIYSIVIHFSYFICEQVLNLNYLVS